VVPPEDPWSALADPVARAAGPLAPSLPRLGVRYVLLIKEADWRADLRRLSGLRRVVDAPDLALYRSLPARPPAFPHPPALPVVAVVSHNPPAATKPLYGPGDFITSSQ